MPANNAINVIDLDYPAILDSLRRYVAADGAFQSYDLNQGGMAAILRVLAYASFNQAFLTNMAVSESFLDSAQLLTSISSHVKELNYVPGSTSSAVASVRMTWTGTSPVYYVQKGSTFSGLVRGAGAVTFSVPETVSVTGNNGSFSVDIDVYEGPYVADAWVVDSTSSTRYVLTNEAVDTDSLTVSVYETGSVTPVTYSRATTLLGVTETSRVWFLQQAETGRYEVLLGDGVAGFAPPDGSRVVAEYRVSRGADGNGVNRLTAAFNPYPGDATNIATSVLATSSGGSAAETLEQIRFRAPRWFRVQERAVSPDDYAIMLTEQFSEIRDAVATGGEDATPPQYGRVVVSVDMSDADLVSQSRRAAYEAFLAARMPLSIRPIVVDADREWASMQVRVWYDPSLAVTTSGAVSAAVSAAVQSWAATNLGGFGASLRVSKLEAAIDAASDAVVASEVRYSMYRLVYPVEQVRTALSAPMGFAIEKPASASGAHAIPTATSYSVWTSSFTTSGVSSWVADDGAGSLRIVQGGRYSVVVGSVDYDTGLVKMQLTVDDYMGAGLRVYARPRDPDYLAAPPGTVLALGDDLSVAVSTVGS